MTVGGSLVNWQGLGQSGSGFLSRDWLTMKTNALISSETLELRGVTSHETRDLRSAAISVSEFVAQYFNCSELCQLTLLLSDSSCAN